MKELVASIVLTRPRVSQPARRPFFLSISSFESVISLSSKLPGSKEIVSNGTVRQPKGKEVPLSLRKKPIPKSAYGKKNFPIGLSKGS